MITPRSTRLIRAESLSALHRAVFRLATRGALSDIRRRAIIVPSRAAAEQLRQTLETLAFDEPLRSGGTDLEDLQAERALLLPDLLTRADWYRRMHERAGCPEPMLSALEREVLLGAAARRATESGVLSPFRLRPGIVASMLDFYDSLRGQQRSLDDFERLVVEDLEPRVEIDRGAERLLRQTRFLVAAFRIFEESVAASGRFDEHILRAALLGQCAGPSGPVAQHQFDGSPFTHLVVTVADRVAEPAGGLHPADFDLMMRMPGVETIHFVATRAQLAAGFGERLHDLVPELEEVNADAEDDPPRLLAPVGEERLHFVARDREEELRSIARRVKVEARASESPSPLGRTAVVFRRRLPYVYLARTVFESAGIEHQAADALPLAAEPMAAVLDLVIECVESGFARASVVSLLRSPHLRLGAGNAAIAPEEIEAFDRRLAELSYLGSAEALLGLAASWKGEGGGAALAAAAVVERLRPLCVKQKVSAHTAALLSFLRDYGRTDIADDAIRSRHLRARAAILGALEQLRRAAETFDDPLVAIADVAATVHRWIESQTFSPRLGASGVQLVDAPAARYGTFDAVHLAGLAEGDWPDPSPRNIFYPAFLLSRLGWPAESARLAAARAEFLDLLRLARHRASASAFTLEDDSIVNPSPLLEELARSGLEVARIAEPETRVFADEKLLAAAEGVGGDGLEAHPTVRAESDGRQAPTWLELRLARSPATDRRFHGDAGAVRRHGYSVTAIDQFLQCPFKYFAGRVLGLPEEPADDASRAPKVRGQFVHEVLRAFFESWQAQGGGAIAPDVLDRARTHFAAVAEAQLSSLPRSDASLERVRLLGSAGTPGVAELVLASEASRFVPVRERLLEYAFEGEFAIAGSESARSLRLRGKADRVDLLADGRFRLIDYKTGKQPELAQTVQLPVYVVCVQQHLERTRGERWEVAEASYLAFGDARTERVVIDGGPDTATKLAEGQQRLLDAVDRIERGDFPPRPAMVRLCGTCAYATVCRKDFLDAD